MANRKTLTINGVNFSLLTGKKAEALVEDYRRAEREGNTRLWHVYGSCSYSKQRAYEDCDTIRHQVGGSIMYIASYTTFVFTLVYVIWSIEGEPDKCYVVKETQSNRFIAKVYKGALR